MVQHVLCALFRDQLASGFRPARADDGHARRARQLHRSNPHAARRAMHQHRFARNSFRALKQSAIRRRVWHIDRRALRKRHLVRQRMHLRRFAKRIFRVSPRQTLAHINAVAGLESVYAIAHRFHHAGAVFAGVKGRGGFAA